MLAHIDFTWQFFTDFMSIVMIDLVLAGDNALVIAMVVKDLPKSTRKWGILIGAAGAVAVRVACTFMVATLLSVQFVKFIGGALIIWIAIKLMLENEKERDQKQTAGVWQAVWLIILADLTMGNDNILAVGAASHGNLPLLIFGLSLSIPFVVFTSSILVGVMEKYPITLYIGVGVLGKVGGEMMITDPFVQDLLNPGKILQYSVIIFSTVAVLAAGRFLLLARRKQNAPATRAD